MKAINFTTWPLGQEVPFDIVCNHHQCQKTFFVARANTTFFAISPFLFPRTRVDDYDEEEVLQSELENLLQLIADFFNQYANNFACFARLF